jgi:hypothetical protein
MNWKWTGNWRDRIWLEGPVRPDSNTNTDSRAQTSKAD